MFMNFEMGDQIYGMHQENESQVDLPKRHQEAGTPKQDLPQQQPEGESLDFYVSRHLPELLEAVLSILCEIYQDSRIPTILDIVHLFTLIQTKTDKRVV
jgi:hypothetical protein